MLHSEIHTVLKASAANPKLVMEPAKGLEPPTD